MAFGGFVAFPRLTVDLPYPRSLDNCQSCGATEDLGASLRVWEEFDDQDQRTGCYLVLCETCSDRIVKPHARLYDRINRHAPTPGAMECCRGCVHRHDLACESPLRKDRGGPGLPVETFGMGPMHINMGRKRHVWIQTYNAPPRCKGREE